jgi:hypothetical protein
MSSLPDDPAPTQAELDLLALADESSVDEYKLGRYVFHTAIGKIELLTSWTEGGASLRLWVPGQTKPAFEANLYGDVLPTVVDDKRGVYIELIGQVSYEHHRRGIFATVTGLRLRLRPHVAVEPYFVSSIN